MKTHEFLRRERDRIMLAWQQAIQKEPRPILLEDSTLRNDLPEFLDALAEWMQAGEEPSGGMLQGVPATHAKQRLKHSYELAQLVAEFRVLRATILGLLLEGEAVRSGGVTAVEEARRRAIELARLNSGLDRAISDSVEYFVNERERIRERFISVLSHDLRAPLTGILMSADQMLRSGNLPPGLDQAVGRISRSATRMNRMVRDLLDLARGRIGGGFPITRARMDMGEVCRTVAEDVRITSPGRLVTVETGTGLWGEWDHDRALQAVGNLVANALQYGRDPVAIAANCVADEVVVEVTNQGETIPQDLVPKLFDPFQRGEGGATRREGLGLGLYILSEIMRAHGGSVAVKSSKEHGTTFTLTWPHAQCAPRAR